jgi:phenylacetate-CoA ligase
MSRWPAYLEADIETMSRSSLLAYQEARILEVVPYAYERSGLVREQWQAAGVTPDDIRSLSDFRQKAPILDKDAMLEYRARTGDPFGGLRSDYDSAIRIGFTSGTTGDPSAMPHGEVSSHNRQIKRDLWQIGLRPGDYFTYNMHTIRRGQGSDRFTDVDFRPIGFAHNESEVRRMMEASALFKPRYFHHFSRPIVNALAALEDRGEIDLKEAFSCYYGGLFAGEAPGPQIYERIRSWGVEIFEGSGLGDVCAAMECREHDGMHTWEDIALVEVMQPGSKEPTPEGVPGELVVTSLYDPISPMVRFRSADLVTWTTAPCACGRTHGRMWTHGRVGDQVVVEGRALMPRDIMKITDAIAEIAGGLFQIIRPQREMAKLMLRVGVDPDIVTNHSAFADRVSRIVSAEFEVPCVVDVVPANELLKLGPPHKIPRVTRI